MSRKLVATLPIGFDSEADDGIGDKAGQNQISLQQMTTRFDSKGQLLARCFPSSVTDFSCSVGKVEPGEIRSQAVSQSLKFDNSSSASLSFPGASAVTILPQVIMRRIKDIDGKNKIVVATDVTLRYDAEKVAVIAEAPVVNPSTNQTTLVPVNIFGSCIVHYTAEYKVLYYKPGSFYFPVGGGGNYAVTFSLGTIYAFNEYDVDSLDMELDTSSTPDWIEYARVTSKIVLDANGTWEYPSNWESTYNNNRQLGPDATKATYPPGRFDYVSYELDAENSFTDTRVHCVIMINTISSLRYDDHNNGGSGYTYWFQPYLGNANYQPIYKLTFNDPPGGAKAGSSDDFRYDLNNRTWRDIFLNVNKGKVLAELREDYPGITES